MVCTAGGEGGTDQTEVFGEWELVVDLVPPERMKVECIDYRQIPRQNPLFVKFVSDYEAVSPFYPPPVHLSIDHFLRRADRLLKTPNPFPREQLAQFLVRFNRKIEADERVFSNIEKLRSPQTLAVVTGQQLGFLGGTALTVYKAATAIRLAQILEEQGYSAVPVFWLASDDSDFQEVRSTVFRNRQDGLFSVTYPGPRQNTPQMVGSIRLEAVEDCLKHLEVEGLKGDFAKEIVDLLRRCYQPQRFFQEGLGAWLAHLFREDGLIFFDSLSNYRKDLQVPFSIAIRKRHELVHALQERGKLLRSKGFDPQVRVADAESLLFSIELESRYKLEFGQSGYWSQSAPSLKLSDQQLLEIVEHGNMEFGPNVLLRPIVQDWLFPTVAYIGGPSEVAYFAQVHAISNWWDVESTVFPRASVTVVPRKAQRLMRKYNLRVSDIFQNRPEDLARKILSSGKSAEILKGFDGVRDRMQAELDGLQAEIKKADSTVGEMLSRAEQKIFYQLGRVQDRFIANQQGERSTLENHLDYLYCHLFPNDRLQERVINFNQLLSEEGPGLVRHLVEAVNPFCPNHQVIYL